MRGWVLNSKNNSVCSCFCIIMLWELKYEYFEEKNCESFIWLVQGVFIAFETCHVAWMKGLEM
jgi:hypothetical protein